MREGQQRELTNIYRVVNPNLSKQKKSQSQKWRAGRQRSEVSEAKYIEKWMPNSKFEKLSRFV